MQIMPTSSSTPAAISSNQELMDLSPTESAQTILPTSSVRLRLGKMLEALASWVVLVGQLAVVKSVEVQGETLSRHHSEIDYRGSNLSSRIQAW